MAIGQATVKVGIEWDEATRKLLDALTAVTTIGPADHLVLVFESLTLAARDHLVEQLRLKHGPLADRVLIVGGAAELAVLRGAEDGPTP